MEQAPLIVIVGPTASGKSDLAIQLAVRYGGEIIAADARTVYRGMDIGTAKPSPADLAKVPHHLLDTREPSEQYTAADFKRDALKAIAEIGGRNRLPIMVGGTGLYIDAVLFDYAFLPKTDEKTRQKLQQLSPKELTAQLEAAGIAFDHIDAKNPRRLQRLLETKGQTPVRNEMRSNTLIIGLEISRSELRERIEKRINAMMRRGLLVEVQNLVEHFGWQAPALNAIGYIEWKPYFEGSVSRAHVGRQILQSSLGLAKRQRTWFKRNRAIQWIRSEQEANKLVEQFLG